MVGPVGHGGGGNSSSASGASRILAWTEGIGSLASRACVTEGRRGLSAARHTATMQAHATEKRDTESGGMRGQTRRKCLGWTPAGAFPVPPIPEPFTR